MAQDGWGAPRIHAELTKLGFIVSEMTVSRYLPRRPTEPDQVKRWVAFLHNHKDDIVAMDLFTVPTASLRLLYGFFVIEHGRRHILHFNPTFNPTSAWVIQQLRNALSIRHGTAISGLRSRFDLQRGRRRSHQVDGNESGSHVFSQPLAKRNR